MVLFLRLQRHCCQCFVEVGACRLVDSLLWQGWLYMEMDLLELKYFANIDLPLSCA